MNRLVVIASLIVLPVFTTGCDSFRDLFSSRAKVAAEAGELELSSERLANILSGAKGIRVGPEAANFVANTWVNYALFAQAAVDGKLPLDSAGVAEGLWPQLAELRGTHWHDTLMARRSVIAPSAADSLYQGGQLRVLQHILFRVPPNAVPEVRNAARKKAEGTLGRIKRGADFGKVAAQVSEDPGSRQDRGFLPPSPKGRFVAAFDSVGWTLAPGAVSGVVETPFGYHIIKRPRGDVVRDRLTAYLTERAGARLDSIYMDSLATTKEVQLTKGATDAMRAALEDPEEARRSDKKLTTFKGGELTVAQFLRWVSALPPQYSAQLQQADDSTLGQFARVLTQNVLLLQQADSAGIRIGSEEWATMAANYRSQVDSLKTDMGVDSTLVDSAATAVQRQRVAEMKVDQYFDRLLSGRSRLRPMPAALGTVLRERYDYRISEDGIERAIQLAQAQQRKADSAKPQAGPLQPAPGPAPIPGINPDTARADTARRDTTKQGGGR